MDHAEIITALGGPTKVMDFLGLEKRSTTHWARRGIPPRYWVKLSKMERADGRGLIPIEVFDEAASRPVCLDQVASP